MTDSIYSVPTSDWESFKLVQSVLDALEDAVFVKDRQHRWITCNQAACVLLGKPRDAIIGHSDPDYFPPEEVEVFWRIDDEVVATGKRIDNEEHFTDTSGELHTIWTRKFPLRNEHGDVVGVAAFVTDFTMIKHRQAQIERLEAEIRAKEAQIDQQQTEVHDKLAIIETQSVLLEQLGAPVIQVWESVLLLPLIGVLDSRRAAQALESLLESITRLGAQVVILDITGVPVVDTSVASHLVRAVQAAQLLGCESILVGISPEIAQTLVGLGVDFSRITTRATLQNGLEYALKRLDYAVDRQEKARFRV
jgi:rsbT co-antagonist protein RsbR